MSKSKPGDIPALLQQAVALHQSGRLDQASGLYDQVLRLDRNNGDALNLKALILGDAGRGDEALVLFGRAAAAQPGNPTILFNQGNVLARLGRWPEAIAAYERAIAIKPGYADAMLNAGQAFHRMGRLFEAIGAFRALAARCPNDARGHTNLGIVLAEAYPGVAEEKKPAIAAEGRAAFDAALARDPANAEIHAAAGAFHARTGDTAAAIVHLQRALQAGAAWPLRRRVETLTSVGEYLRQQQRFAEAVASQREAARLDPGDRDVRYNLAAALASARFPAEAEQQYRSLIAQHPAFVRPYVNLGNLLREDGRFDEAMDVLETALEQQSGLSQAYANIGAIFMERGWAISAIMLLDKANALKSDDMNARLDRSVVLLSLGRLGEGWQEYETRFLTERDSYKKRPTPPPYWQGEDLAGKTILIWTDQGLGDEMFCAAMYDEVIGQARHCILECSERMAPVYARAFPKAEIAPRDAHNQPPHAQADCQIAATSLGRFLRPSLASIPQRHGYLKPDPARLAERRAFYESKANGRRIVGLSWRSANPKQGPSKSAQLVDFAPLLNVPGLFFVNLQYGDCAAELAAAREKTGVEVFQDPAVDSRKDIDAFMAQVAAMDLVITTSNTTAHAAGAQDVPVWVLLPHARGVFWYWFLKRTDSPWYPSATLLRGDTAEGWVGETVTQAAPALRAWSKGSKPA